MRESPNPFAFTCPKCEYRGNTEADLEFVKTLTPRATPGEYKSIEIEKWPWRCLECKAMKKKYTRMKKTLQRLTDYSMDKKMGYPKMLTVALPSEYGDQRSKMEQITELRKKWRKLRAVLKEAAGIDAGVSVVECTAKVTFTGYAWSYQDGKQVWKKVCEPDLFGVPKSHAHIHAAVCMPYKPKEEFVELCSTAGESVGLGRLNIVGKKSGRSYDYKKHLANYLSKYLSKSNDTGNASNFGKLIGYRSPEPTHG